MKILKESKFMHFSECCLRFFCHLKCSGVFIKQSTSGGKNTDLEFKYILFQIPKFIQWD